MRKQTLIRSILVLALALTSGYISACSGIRAGASPAISPPVQALSVAPAEGENMTQDKMMDRCQKMKEQKEKMKEDMKSQDTELTEQITKMNSAPENKKLSLMAAVITRMVEQRITMDAQKAKMEEEMMKHMMQHMQVGMESMSQCPMMKDMDDKS
jgi:hypothetical protein